MRVRDVRYHSCQVRLGFLISVFGTWKPSLWRLRLMISLFFFAGWLFVVDRWCSLNCVWSVLCLFTRHGCIKPWVRTISV